MNITSRAAVVRKVCERSARLRAMGVRIIAWLVAAVLMFAASSARADEWTNTDTVMEVAVMGTLVVDYLQTRQVTDPGGRTDHYERNPMIGEGGWKLSATTYFASAIIVHAVAARVLPNPYRRVFQSVTIAVEGGTVIDNWRGGIAVEF